MKIQVKITGSGTKSEVKNALIDIVEQLGKLADGEIAYGGDIENSILICSFDECLTDGDEQ